MHAEAFRQQARQYVRQQLRQLLHWVQDPAPPEVAAESTTGPPRPNPVHELSPILSRLVESQERLIKEVREVTERPEPLDPSRDDSGGGTAVTYDWEPGRSSSPW
jgi:hypothetical protein